MDYLVSNWLTRRTRPDGGLAVRGGLEAVQNAKVDENEGRYGPPEQEDEEREHVA